MLVSHWMEKETDAVMAAYNKGGDLEETKWGFMMFKDRIFITQNALNYYKDRMIWKSPEFSSQVTTFAALSTVKFWKVMSDQELGHDLTPECSCICCRLYYYHLSGIPFEGGKSEIKQTNDMLDTLILYAINRGFLTAACALINLVLFLAIPGKFYFFLGLVCSSKSCLLHEFLLFLKLPNLFFIGGDSVDWNSILATTNRSQFAVPSVPIFPSHGIITVNEEALELQDTSGKQVSGVHSNGKEGQQKMSIG
ncbi:hypothetical protein L218DRAFT_946116 [Marasmius fiardii PR-910]|nr:hypothetical protein L218DRAFT_946116 [Marasmius fiardii PR-910]